MSEGVSRVLVLQRDNIPKARLDGSTGVLGRGSRELVLQRYNRPLAWLEGSSIFSEGGSRVLVLRLDSWPVAWLEGSTGTPGRGSWELMLQRDTWKQRDLNLAHCSTIASALIPTCGSARGLQRATTEQSQCTPTQLT